MGGGGGGGGGGGSVSRAPPDVKRYHHGYHPRIITSPSSPQQSLPITRGRSPSPIAHGQIPLPWPADRGRGTPKSVSRPEEKQETISRSITADRAETRLCCEDKADEERKRKEKKRKEREKTENERSRAKHGQRNKPRADRNQGQAGAYVPTVYTVPMNVSMYCTYVPTSYLQRGHQIHAHGIQSSLIHSGPIRPATLRPDPTRPDPTRSDPRQPLPPHPSSSKNTKIDTSESTPPTLPIHDWIKQANPPKLVRNKKK